MELAKIEKAVIISYDGMYRLYVEGLLPNGEPSYISGPLPKQNIPISEYNTNSLEYEAALRYLAANEQGIAVEQMTAKEWLASGYLEEFQRRLNSVMISTTPNILLPPTDPSL